MEELAFVEGEIERRDPDVGWNPIPLCAFIDIKLLLPALFATESAVPAYDISIRIQAKHSNKMLKNIGTKGKQGAR